MPQRCLIAGAGVVGLSIAYELARRSWRVEVIDRGDVGREASWAGAGILPPTNLETALDPLDRLRAISHELHRHWAERLLAETGIDNGLRQCGGLYLARTAGETALLAAFAQLLAEQRIECHRRELAEAIALEPALESAIGVGAIQAVYELPGECQLRNPRHLAALHAACRQLGVEFRTQCDLHHLNLHGERIASVATSQGDLCADAFIVASGAWTQRLLAHHGVATGIFPVRGQMVLFRCAAPPIRRIVNEGPRYLVPREDGYVLAGSTEEEAGFDKSNTPDGVEELKRFAYALVPALVKGTIERTWAGLRPASFDGFPYIGSMPGTTNGFVAAGHFRSGLHLSTGTALVLAQLMCGETPAIELAPFRVSRG